MSGLWEQVWLWLLGSGVVLGKKLVGFVLIMAVGFLLARLASRTVRLALEKSHLKPSPLFIRFSTNVTGRGLMLIAVIVGLGVLGVDTGALIAGLGVSGLVLGFALKDTLSNFAAGGMILLYQPFDIGHSIEVSGVAGVVKDLTLVTTVLHTADNRVIMIPNSKVWGNNIVNVSLMATRRIDLTIGVASKADVDEVVALFESVLRAHAKVLKSPAAEVSLRGLSGSSMSFLLSAWVRADEFESVRAELLRTIKYRLEEAQIAAA